MSDATWIEVLKQVAPDYDDLKQAMEDGPKIKAAMRKINLRWRVRIEEDWGNGEAGEYYYTADYRNLDKRCEWAAEQLKNWKFVTRLSHQEWKFFNKVQAEKFVMMFNLKWAE